MTSKTGLATALVAAVVAAIVSAGTLGVLLFYVTKNPEILAKIRAEINSHQEQERAAQLQRAISDNADALFRSDTVSLRGQSEGRRHSR